MSFHSLTRPFWAKLPMLFLAGLFSLSCLAASSPVQVFDPQNAQQAMSPANPASGPESDAGSRKPVAESSASSGFLEQHELAGGHLISRHIGKSEQSLKQRLRNEPRISGSSSFYDHATAETTVKNAVRQNQPQISRWLGSQSARHVIVYKSAQPVGLAIQRGQQKATPVNSARIILQRDQRMPNGYRIVTGYPVR